MRPLILIVEDEVPQAEVLAYNLESEGFEVRHTASGEEGLLLAKEYLPAAIVLDWMLPDISGIEVCRRLKVDKDARTIPVLMLTARGEEDDKVRGLETGADDYMVKPHSIRELIARLHALLRRTANATDSEFSYAGLTLNTETHRVTRDGQTIKLGPTEYRLLKTFLSRPHKVWSRMQLLDRVWGMDSEIEDRTVDVHVGRLRSALNKDGLKNLIRTVRGAGYALDENE